jgi:GNAT superfamily N-acetyltransferase
MKDITLKYEIREMTICDIDSVAQLYNDLAYYVKNDTSDLYFDFEELTVTEISEYLKSSLDKKNMKTYIAAFAGEIVGFITGEIIDCFLPISSTKNVGYISGCFIKENHRKKGITKILTNKIEDFFKVSNIRFVELHCISGNSVAEKTWSNLGFSTFRLQMRKSIT